MKKANPARPRKRGTPARTRSAARASHSSKPTIAAREFAARLKSLLAEFPTLYAIWDKPEIDPAFREELMVAVARQNDAPYCNWAHRTWAESVGASQAELAKIESSRLGALSLRKRAAVEYVRALAAANFERVPGELRRKMASFYTPREIRNIELVAAVMDLINRSANTYEAMVSRLQGNPGGRSNVTDELFFSSVFLTVAPLMVLILSRTAGRSYVDMVQSLVGYVQNHYAQRTGG